MYIRWGKRRRALLYWKGRRVAFTEHAAGEMMRLYWDESDVEHILSEGGEGRRRKEGIFEFELRRGKKVKKVVAAESLSYFSGKLVWLIVHVGEFTAR